MDSRELSVMTAFDVVDESASQSEAQTVFWEQVVRKCLRTYRMVVSGSTPTSERMAVEYNVSFGESLSW